MRVLRVALVSGIIVRNDAISNGLRLKLHLFSRLRAQGAPVDVHAFCTGTDYEDEAIVAVDSIAGLARDHRYQAADVVIFEFGIYFPLFDALFLTRPTTARVGVYHNISPEHLVDDPGTRHAVRRSSIQKHNLALCEHIICDSELNRDDLVGFGIPEDRLTIAHLPGSLPSATTGSRRSRDPVVRLLFLGRLVRAKGIEDLLEAFRRARHQTGLDIRLTLVGRRAFADPDIRSTIDTLTESLGSTTVTVIDDATDGRLAELMRGADALVIPSYHEGYCVPVVEALRSGCFVVGYDNSNLPNVTGGLAHLVPTGDVGSLTAALASLAQAVSDAGWDRSSTTLRPDRGALARPAWEALVSAHLEDYTSERHDAAVLRATAAAVALASGPRHPWLLQEAARLARAA